MNAYGNRGASMTHLARVLAGSMAVGITCAGCQDATTAAVHRAATAIAVATAPYPSPALTSPQPPPTSPTPANVADPLSPALPMVGAMPTVPDTAAPAHEQRLRVYIVLDNGRLMGPVAMQPPLQIVSEEEPGVLVYYVGSSGRTEGPVRIAPGNHPQSVTVMAKATSPSPAPSD